jgi:hypothetical protein
MTGYDQGKKQIQWACSAFEYNWHIVWDSQSVNLSIYDRQNQCLIGDFILKKEDFLAENSKILHVIMHYLELAGYNSEENPWLLSMKTVLSRIQT